MTGNDDAVAASQDRVGESNSAIDAAICATCSGEERVRALR